QHVDSWNARLPVSGAPLPAAYQHEGLPDWRLGTVGDIRCVQRLRAGRSSWSGHTRPDLARHWPRYLERRYARLDDGHESIWQRRDVPRLLVARVDDGPRH